MDQKAVGEYLKRLRVRAKYTQIDLGTYIGVTDKAISRWESGVGMPEISNLMELAKLYGITVDDILNMNESVFDVADPPAAECVERDPQNTEKENASSDTCSAPDDVGETRVSNTVGAVSAKSNKLSKPSVKFPIILLFAYFLFGVFIAVKMPALGDVFCAAFCVIISVLVFAITVVGFVRKFMPHNAYRLTIVSLWAALTAITAVLTITAAALGRSSEDGAAVAFGSAVMTLMFVMQLLYVLIDLFVGEKVKKVLHYCAIGVAAACIALATAACIAYGASLDESNYVPDGEIAGFLYGENLDAANIQSIDLAILFAAIGAFTFALAQAYSKWVNILTIIVMIPTIVVNCGYIVFCWNIELQDTVIILTDVFNTNLCVGFVIIALMAIVIGWFFEGHKPDLIANRIISIIGIAATVPLVAFTFDAFALNIVYDSVGLATAAFLRITVLAVVLSICVKLFRFDLIYQFVRNRRKQNEKA